MAVDHEFLLRRSFGLAQQDDIVAVDVPLENQTPQNHNMMSLANLEKELSQNMLHLGLADTAAKGGLREAQKEEYKDTAYALSFALLAINNINMKSKVIAKANQLIASEPCNDVEKWELHRDMMSSINEKFKIETDNPAANAFVKDLQDCYNANYRNGKDPDAFLKEGLAYVYSVSNALKEAKPNQDIGAVLKDVSDRFNKAGMGKLGETIAEWFAAPEIRREISRETEPVRDSVKSLEIAYNDYNKEMLAQIYSDIGEHKRLNGEQIGYLSQIFDNFNKEVRGNETAEFEDFQQITVDGRPMIEDNKFLSIEDRYTLLFDNILSGKDVGLKAKDGSIVHMKPEVVEKNAPKNIFQWFIDFIKNLFDSSKEKTMVNADSIKETENMWKFSNAEREKVTFNELIGNDKYGMFDFNKAGKSKDMSAGEKSAELNSPER